MQVNAGVGQASRVGGSRLSGQYAVVFDACAVGYRNWWFPAAGALMGLIFYLIDRFQRRWPVGLLGRPWRSAPKWGYRFLACWTLIAALGTGYDYINVCGSLRGGEAFVVEGRVHSFRLEHDKAQSESFIVSARRYEYSPSRIQAGFNTTVAVGGPIRDGLQVRIHDVGGQIARLEIQQ